MMNNRIYTYTNLAMISDNAWFDEISKYPQIAVSTDLRKGINAGIARFKYKSIDIKQLLNMILPSWTIDETKFRENVLISQYIRERIKNAKNDSEKKWLVGCKRNISSILSSIILLEEADVKPEEIEADDNNIELLVEVWRRLLDDEPEFLNFRKQIKEFSSGPKVKEIVESVFGEMTDNTIVIHGFYYFTPIQIRIMEALENSGYELIYLFQYDKRYKTANEIWTRTYTLDNGFIDSGQWVSSETGPINEFGELLEGKIKDIHTNLRVIEYKNILEFVKDIKRAKEEKFAIYCSEQIKANNILKDFYPEEYGERKLLSYPIGQFVYTLNNMWNDDEQTIVLDTDSLRQCFSSGWLSADGLSSKEYTKDLEYILPFFDKCKTVEEWNNRIELLESIYDNVIDQFNAQNSQHHNGDMRWQSVYDNPLNSFSMFAVDKDRLSAVIGLITRLIQMATELFGSDDEIMLGKHIQKLDGLLRTNQNAKGVYSEEREIIKELFSRLGKSEKSQMRCFPADVSTAIGMLMEQSQEDEERRTYKVGMVYPLYQIDAAPIKNRGKVHICLCDIENMPGKKTDYVWPLTEKMIQEIISRTHNKYLKTVSQIMNNAPICNRYFMYSAMANKRIEISWIDNINDKKLAPSPYIQIMHTLGNVKIDKSADYSLSMSHIKQIELSAKEISKYEFGNSYAAKEAMMDYAICPLRYAYGYVLQRYPAYQTTFLHNYAVNGLITAVYYLTIEQGDISEIQEEVLNLFPNLRRVEKRQIMDYLMIEKEDKNTDMNMTSEYEDIAYTDERLKVKFPYKDVREEAKKRYGELKTPSGRKGMDINEHTDVKMACVFCQHAENCINAVHMLDQEDVYD